jgi:hypothetical protein
LRRSLRLAKCTPRPTSFCIAADLAFFLKQDCLRNRVLGGSLEEDTAHQDVSLHRRTLLHPLTRYSGYAAASPDGTIFVSNLEDGIDSYTTPPIRLLKSIPLGRQHLRHRVSTLVGGAYIAIGSEEGKPLVLEPNGHLHQALPHDSRLVPVVAVRRFKDGHD